MPEASPARISRGLSEESFERLLACLDADREAAGEKYEVIRRKLLAYFRYNRCPHAEELVDQTFDCVAGKLPEVRELMAFIRGVARNIIIEAHRKAKSVPLEELPVLRSRESTGDESEIEAEQRDGCLQQCLARLSSDQRELILEYYRCEGAQKIQARMMLAERKRLTANALGVQTCRIRARLLECVTPCMRSAGFDRKVF